jgi:hypothetical protein
MSDVILCDISDANDLIKEARLDWTNLILFNLGVPEDIILTQDVKLLRHEISNNYGIEVDLLSNGTVNIYKKQWNDSKIEELQGWLPLKKEHMVAQWKEPKRIKKIENKKIYYEIHINEWSFVNMRKQ